MAVAVLKLQEQGLLQLTDNLVQLLPSTRGNIPQAEQITVRHLLNHTSGIVDPPNESIRYQLSIVDNAEERFKQTTNQLLNHYVYGKPLHFAPGSGWQYSNTNYWLLGQIIEQKTGKRLHDVLDQWIFRPLGMSATYLEVRDDRNVVRGYTDIYGNGRLFDIRY